MNINVNSTVQCHGCKAQYHLPCFDVILPAVKIFVIRNIVFLCDDCLSTDENSPKRKVSGVQKPPILKQSTLTPGGMLSSPTSSSQTKNTTTEQLRKLVENLSNKIDVNTNTVASLKDSVDSMHQTVSSNSMQIDESLKKNDTEISSAAKTIVEHFEKFEQKQTYAQALGASSSNEIVHRLSSESSLPALKKKTVVNKFKGQPLLSGTNEDSIHNLGAPVVFTERRRRQNSSSVSSVPAKPKLTKSVYISRLQPSVTVDGLKLYLHTQIKDLDESQMSIRMLVKKDQELSELSFISFSISCTENLFSQLNSPSFWPSHIKMREFINEPRKPRENAVKKASLDDKSSTTTLSDAVNDQESQPKNEVCLPVQPASEIEFKSSMQSMEASQ